MSAYIVSNKTIDCIVRGFRESHIDLSNYAGPDDWAYDRISWLDSTRIGQALVDQNYASVNYHDGGDRNAPRYQCPCTVDELNYRDLYGCIRCYEYQSCETPNWMQSGICHTLSYLKEWVTEQLIIDRYGDGSPWGLK